MKRVLFIGNSYTYFNKLWDHFSAIAEAHGIELCTEEVTKGGYRLSQMNDPENPYGAIVAQKLAGDAYDIVFLQEQSLAPVLETERFWESVRELNRKIRKNGACPILYETWGRKHGSPQLQEHGMTHESMTEGLKRSYRKIGQELGIAVSPAGEAFSLALHQYPQIELYNPDCTHPSEAGTYLAALCHVATAFGINPVGTTDAYALANRENAQLLQEVARQALRGAKDHAGCC